MRFILLSSLTSLQTLVCITSCMLSVGVVDDTILRIFFGALSRWIRSEKVRRVRALNIKVDIHCSGAAINMCVGMCRKDVPFTQTFLLCF